MTTIYFSQARNRALQQLDEPRAGSWIHVIEPDAAELDTLAERYDLDRDNLTDAVDLYEAPRIEVEDKAVYLYTRYCFPEGSDIATEPLLIVYTSDHIITICRKDTSILGRMTEDKIEFVTTQKTKMLLLMLNEINRSYELHIKRLGKRVLQLRAQIRQSRLSNREFLGIIELEEDLNEFLSALQPQSLLFRSLLSGKWLRLYEEDRDIIEDIERSTAELIELVRGRIRSLGSMREAYNTISTNNLNAIFKRLTSIAIFMTIPTVISGLWGMNVQVPFKDTTYGFWAVCSIVAISTTAAIMVFRRKRWL